MNLRLSELDKEIQLAEQLIVRNRQALDDALNDSVQRARDKARATLTSPLFLVGVGSALFYMLTGRRRKKGSTEAASAAATPMKKSLWGILGAAGYSLAQSHFGGPVGMAQWAVGKLKSRRPTASASAASGSSYLH